jgi:hypothetical protein
MTSDSSGPPSSVSRRPFSSGPRGSRTHYPSIKSRELILMSFRPFSILDRWRFFAIQNPTPNPNSKCSGRDSNSDHALIWCLQGISLPLCQLSYRSNSNNWCARRDSNPPPRFKRPVLRHQSFERVALAAGFEPALTALEEQRLVPLGHASNSSGDEGTRTLDSLVDNQVH